MEVRALSYVASACEGVISNDTGGTLVEGLCTDSRRAQRGQLFVALAGDRFDGHAYIEEAIARGVSAVVVERGRVSRALPSIPIITVDSTRLALGRLAAAYRKDFQLPVVAVAGSNGKTTTKELTASVLRQRMDVLWSEASFNNDIGVPFTLLRLQRTHGAAVVEAGTNHPGELAPLVRMIAPQYGVITNIGREHLEFFKDIAGVAEEEGQLAELLPASGKLFLNSDDEWTPRIARRTRATVVRVGFAQDSDWRASDLRLEKQGTAFRVEAPQADFSGEFRIQLVGKHQVLNALFAMVVGVELGLGRAEIERGLAECKAAKMRLQIRELNGVRVLDDAYNANADSVLAALQTLVEFPWKGRRIAVLGDMAELGAHSEAAHQEIGRRAAELGVGQLFAIGTMAPVIARAAREAGLNRVFEFGDVETAAAAVRSFVRAGDLVLLKASRASRFERITEALETGDGGRKD